MDDDFFEEEEDVIFGEDEVFDYIMYEEVEKESQTHKGSGCFTVFIIIFIPVAGLYFIFNT
jgi:hypothetical protein